MLLKIRKSKFTKFLAVFMGFNLLISLIGPQELLAITSGPSQPEVQSFSPVGTSDMVDIFSGDFSYNIPLLDVGGYPINLSYNGGISMEQEASWVGLGWNINPGVITRTVRGLPDDFDGDRVEKQMNVKANNTFSVTVKPDLQTFGIKIGDLAKASFGLGLSYNTYRGYGFTAMFAPSIMNGKECKLGMNASLGMSVSSTDGVDINPSVSFSANTEKKIKGINKLDCTAGLGYNSLAGLKSFAFTGGAKVGKVHQSGDVSNTFAQPTYTPEISMPMNNLNLSLEVTLGSAVFGAHLNGTVLGAYSGQVLANKVREAPAYGYMYTHHNEDSPLSMLDFNREGESGFMPDKPNLPLTNYTYDVYSVNGQGIGGTYRPFRGEIDYIYDKLSVGMSGGVDLGGIEIGVGGTNNHVGFNGTLNSCISSSQKWTNDNDLDEALQYWDVANRAPEDFEPCYFRAAGEASLDPDNSVFKLVGEYDPVEVEIGEKLKQHTAFASFVKENGNSTGDVTGFYRQKRMPRNDVIQVLDAEMASEMAIDDDITYFQNDNDQDSDNDFLFTQKTGSASGIFEYECSKMERVHENRKGHHISEITTLRSDGARYVFGIPAYNNTQVDKVFSVVGGLDATYGTLVAGDVGLVGYDEDTDANKGNSKGQDHFFSQTTLPAYAHSFLLTSVLSSDYIDKTLDGPTDDDLGSYTKFNYTLRHENFKWREPFYENMANYMEGMRSIPNDASDTDDKAGYTYGEKELWYLHSIETKTHVAEFHISDREDGVSTKGKEGGIGDQKSCRLKKIILYNKYDKIREAKDGIAAIPVKTVYFEYYGYDDSDDASTLCHGIPNTSDANKGKLTLKRIYFTHGNSQRGYLNAYRFNYGQRWNEDGTIAEVVNPEYNLKGNDRWGSYQENNPDIPDFDLTNPEFPYTRQNYKHDDPSILEADYNAIAWNLTSITLPSGGLIKVDYEADDYAYVQNKKAMQMFKVIGAQQTLPVDLSETTNNLVGPGSILSPNSDNNLFLIIELPHEYTNADFERDFLMDYNARGRLVKMNYMYFKFLVRLHPGIPDTWEYIPGYAQIEDGGMIGSSTTHAYIEIKPEKIPEKSEVTNPIALAAWNFIRLNRSELATAPPEATSPMLNKINESNQMDDIMEEIVEASRQIESMITGMYKMLRKDGKGKKFDKDKSWIRLYSPYFNIDSEQILAKKGGGHRVKKIILDDQWSQLLNESTSDKNSLYGQEYSYSIEKDGKIMSSGVASYEPLLGGDENPFKKPVKYKKDLQWAPDERYYMEEPFGESFFPGPRIGYRQVTVRSIRPANTNKTGTGRTVHEFYTAKDFPTKVNFTSLQPHRKKPSELLNFMKTVVKDFMTTSQGYCIELNDMHGKPKAQWSYNDALSEPISGTEYKYSVDENNQLKNEVKVVYKDGKIEEKTVGVDFDFVVDMRQQVTETSNQGVKANLDQFLASVIPVVIPMILPEFTYEKTRYRSVVTTKVINRYGQIKKVIAYDNGAKVETENCLYDAETGQVLLTRTKNAFKDDVFNFSYPAHWAYSGMGPAYKNIGATVLANSNLIMNGDEVYDVEANERLWISQSGIVRSFVDRNGEHKHPSGDLVIIRSGARNMQSVPVGATTTMLDPDMEGYLSFDKVLNASAIEYTDKASVFCAEGYLTPGEQFNPFIEGTRGNWKNLREWAYLTDRTQSNDQGNTNIRKDGVYKDFMPFWKVNGGNDWVKNTKDWTSSQEVSLFAPDGTQLESKDALDRHSSAVMGYNQGVVKATAANAKYKEIGYDGFEDYDNNRHHDPHFSFEQSLDENSNITLTQEKKHTGRNAIYVPAGENAEINKEFKNCE